MSKDKRTNLEWFYENDEQFCIAVGEQAFARLSGAPSHPYEVRRWLMSEHVDQSHVSSPNETGTRAENDMDALGERQKPGSREADSGEPVSFGAPKVTGSEADTREKLEADVRQYANPSGGTGNLGACWEKKMLAFLDRQAAITERELEESRARVIQTMKATGKRYRAKIAELEAELDRCGRQEATSGGRPLCPLRFGKGISVADEACQPGCAWLVDVVADYDEPVRMCALAAMAMDSRYYTVVPVNKEGEI